MKKKKKKILVIGHFGGDKNFLDGQTVKTKVLTEELLKTGKYEIHKVDTYLNSVNKFKLLFISIMNLIRCRDVFVLVSGGGMSVYFPMLYFFSKIRRTRVYHAVIGGNLDQYIEKYPKYKKYLNAFKVNWVEIGSMQKKLEAIGIKNASVLPNFKELQNVSAEDYCDDVFRFCTFSRVMKEKGIEVAVDAVKRINSECGKTVCTLDIYGAVDSRYTEDFENLKKNFGNDVSYGGLVPFQQSVSVMKNYYALLFPTFWDGEGFPGTILDAYASAVPVIASDWNYNKELVSHMRTGIVYPDGDMQSLYDAMKWAMEHRTEMKGMRKQCEQMYLGYKPEFAMAIIDQMIFQERDKA